MRIQIICPLPPHSVYGSQVTAVRWANMLHALDHSVELSQHYGGTICDLLVAMRAEKTAEAVIQFHKRHPGKHCFLVLNGTDVYGNCLRSDTVFEAMRLADRVITFQPLAAHEIPEEFRSKVRTIYQSADRTSHCYPADSDSFLVSVVGHLRADKDPLRAAVAARRLPKASRIRVVQAGDCEAAELLEQARAEALTNPRYRYLGPIPRWKVRQLMASSRLLVVSSLMESGANVISEAAVDYVPVLASRIPGNVGVLGEDYPGYFPAGNTRALTSLLVEAENDPCFYQELKTRCALLARRFLPEREQAEWKKLLVELAGGREVNHVRRLRVGA
jgi:putative glycosyltransferase (TIGR04348 family)